MNIIKIDLNNLIVANYGKRIYYRMIILFFTVELAGNPSDCSSFSDPFLHKLVALSIYTIQTTKYYFLKVVVNLQLNNMQSVLVFRKADC